MGLPMNMKEFARVINMLHSRKNEMARFVKVFQSKVSWRYNYSGVLDTGMKIFKNFTPETMGILAEMKKSYPSDAAFIDAVKEISHVSVVTEYIDKNFMDLEILDVINDIGQIDNIIYTRHLLRRIADVLRPMDVVDLGLLTAYFDVSIPDKRTYVSNHVRALCKTFGKKPLSASEAGRNFKALRMIIDRIEREKWVSGSDYIAHAFQYVFTDDAYELSRLVTVLPDVAYIGLVKGEKVNVYPKTIAVRAISRNKFLKEIDKEKFNFLMS